MEKLFIEIDEYGGVQGGGFYAHCLQRYAVPNE